MKGETTYEYERDKLSEMKVKQPFHFIFIIFNQKINNNKKKRDSSDEESQEPSDFGKINIIKNKII